MNTCARCKTTGKPDLDVRWRAIHGEYQCSTCAGVLARARALRPPRVHAERVRGKLVLDQLHVIGTPDEIRAASALFGEALNK